MRFFAYNYVLKVSNPTDEVISAMINKNTSEIILKYVEYSLSRFFELISILVVFIYVGFGLFCEQSRKLRNFA